MRTGYGVDEQCAILKEPVFKEKKLTKMFIPVKLNNTIFNIFQVILSMMIYLQVRQST